MTRFRLRQRHHFAITMAFFVGVLVTLAMGWVIGLRNAVWMVGVAFIGAAVARGLLPWRAVPYLAVRSRWFDAALLGLLGVSALLMVQGIPLAA